ncbi:MAG: SufD family Fe-S cluster assembly protein, partial [Bacilli bacterium]|nr:SufD family Fe-S cluster assembly protein [Bacilli bacterium]
KGTLIFNVLGIVPNNIVNCDLNQSNRIINFTNNLCQINPNLYVDENDVIANHSAYIGNFNENEIFYLMRLGIPYEQATILLIKGFMLKNINKSLGNKVKSVIKKYWR